MFKNTAGQKVTVFAVNSATGAPKTGDAANITVYVSQDDGTVTVLGDTSATEADSVNAPGDYLFDLTQAETNANKLRFSGKSATSGVYIVPQTIYTQLQESGYPAARLVATGLDSISVSDPGAPSAMTTLPKMIVGLFRRFYKKVTMTSTQMKTFADDGTTVNATSTVSDDGTTQTQGASS